MTAGTSLSSLAHLSTNASDSDIVATLNQVVDDIELSHDISNDAWLLSSAFLIFTMQAGFAMLESGMIPVRFSVNVMMKISGNVAATALGFFLVGWAFAYGSSAGGFIGHTHFFLIGLSADDYALWFYNLSVAVTAATVVSGAVAGRMRYAFYLSFSFFVAAFVFPLASHWHWHEDGWLHHLHYHDFAGAGPIHILGTVVGLLCSLILGPREGVFTANGTYIPIRSSPFNTVFGSLLLLIGWFSLNASSGHSIQDGKHELATLSAVNSAVASGAGMSTAIIFLYARGKEQHVDAIETMKAAQASLVSICASCDLVYPFEAAIIGTVGALLCLLCSPLLVRWRIDDPVGIFGSHGVAGLWALIAVGLFSHQDNLSDTSMDGLFRSGSFELLGHQLVGALAFIAWGLLCGGVFIWVVAMYIMPIRIPKTMEKIGSDTVEHNLLSLVRNNRIPMHMITSSRNGDTTSFISALPADMTSMRASASGSIHQMHFTHAAPKRLSATSTRTMDAAPVHPKQKTTDTAVVAPSPLGGPRPSIQIATVEDESGHADNVSMPACTAPVHVNVGSPGMDSTAVGAVDMAPKLDRNDRDTYIDVAESEGGVVAPHTASILRGSTQSASTYSIGSSQEWHAGHGRAAGVRSRSQHSWASSLASGLGTNEADILLSAEEMSITIDLLDKLSAESSIDVSDEDRRSRRPSVLAGRVMDLANFFTDQMTGGTSKKPKKNKLKKQRNKRQYRVRMQDRLRNGAGGRGLHAGSGSAAGGDTHLRPPSAAPSMVHFALPAERQRMPSIDEGGV